MDDLLDLSWGTAPGPAPGTGRDSAPQTVQPRHGGNVFEILARPARAGSSVDYRSTTPLCAPGPSRSGASTPAPLSGTGQNDAFSSLLGIPGSGSGSGSGGKGMTMAEKQAALVEEKRKEEEAQKRQFEADGQFWESLGGGGGESRTTNGLDGFETLLMPLSAPSAPSAPSLRTQTTRPSSAVGKPAHGSFWDSLGNDNLPSTNTPKPPPLSHSSTDITSPLATDPFDFDAFETSLNTKPPSLSVGPAQARGSGDDDILGELGKPAVAIPKPTHAVPRQSKRPAARVSSPPPHVIGQLVEMGFAPAQARRALAQTADGLDVQAALEVLLVAPSGGGRGAGGAVAGAAGAGREDGPEVDDDVVEYERRRREGERERRQRRRAGPTRDAVRARTTEERDREREREGGTTEQAERIIAQASEIGQSVLSKASLFWNTSKEKAMKAYEEQRKVLEESAARQAGEEKRKDGRPRWMQEAEEWKDVRPQETTGGFRDSDEEEQGPRAGSSGNGQMGGRREAALPGKQARPVIQDDDLLFGRDQPVSIKSVPSRSQPAPTQTAPKPAPLPSRNIITATPQQLQTSATHKAKGNNHFKLGRFTEAESAYTLAITCLPQDCIHLIPLLNNRATARLKLGDSANAVSDCTAAINLIGPLYHPLKEAPLPAEYAEIKLGEGISKAMVKRAQAWEMGEKWTSALEDWERVMGLDQAVLGSAAGSTRNMAVEGARRARRMMEAGDRVETAVKPVAAPRRPAATAPKPSSKPADVDRSAAVADLRKAAQAIEAEEEARLHYKDAVDAKIASWKGGKETNLRALIASLDTVLWDDIIKGGLKVGMHELVTDKQVKIKYMKVIARLHPDKLDTRNTTVEQRMLANAAFGALSDAWQAFSQ